MHSPFWLQKSSGQLRGLGNVTRQSPIVCSRPVSTTTHLVPKQLLQHQLFMCGLEKVLLKHQMGEMAWDTDHDFSQLMEAVNDSPTLLLCFAFIFWLQCCHYMSNNFIPLFNCHNKVMSFLCCFASLEASKVQRKRVVGLILFTTSSVPSKQSSLSASVLGCCKNYLCAQTGLWSSKPWASAGA